MQHEHFLNLTRDMVISKRQGHATLPFPKIDMRHQNPPHQGPHLWWADSILWQPAPWDLLCSDRRYNAGWQLFRSNPLGGFSRLDTVCIYMYVFCAYFSDLDGALYFCKLLFCTWPLANFRASTQMGAILFPVWFQFVFTSKKLLNFSQSEQSSHFPTFLGPAAILDA